MRLGIIDKRENRMSVRGINEGKERERVARER